MDFLDIDSFRSRYSDLTVTAVPAKRHKLDTQEAAPYIRETAEPAKVEPVEAPVAAPVAVSMTQSVDIIPLSLPNADAPRDAAHQQSIKPLQQQKFSQDPVSYANEYRQVLAKLEYTKYVQAQLNLMSLSNGLMGSAFDSNRSGNIVDAYDKLLTVIAEMHKNLGPAAIGIRAPKERLLRDIAHARVLVRECVLTLMRDADQAP